MASVARITDIRGLVSLNDGEEILKEKDPISENGGILTISDFARIIFDDGREIEVQGPAQITLNENYLIIILYYPIISRQFFEKFYSLKHLLLWATFSLVLL